MAPPPADLPFDARAVLLAEGALLSSAARRVGLDAPIAFLPSWCVRDAVAHTTGVHRWAARVVEQHSMDVPGPVAPDVDGDALLDHYDEGLALLVAALDAADPEATVPNFLRADPTVRFWWRRQAHETTIHRWDVEAGAGAGAAHQPIPDAVALDGLDELLTGMALRRKGHTLERPVLVAAGGAAWRLGPSPDDPGRLAAERIADRSGPPPDVSGPPADLLLALWKRLPADHPTLRCSGDDAAVFLAGPLTP